MFNAVIIGGGVVGAMTARTLTSYGMEECIKGADLIICGVSSFGMEWRCNNVIPKLPARIPLLSISKSMVDDCENNLNIYFALLIRN